MDDLSKSQLILLALLVSFVVSIATSVMTASLLEQAPPRVTQTIHRVVERTVETVTPSEKADEPDVITQEKTIIVKEEDAITETIAAVSPSVIRLYITENAAADDDDEITTAEQATRFRGLAVVFGDDGLIVTSSRTVAGDPYDLYQARLHDGTTVNAAVDARQDGLTHLSLVAGGAAMPPVVFAEGTGLRLGQTVIGIGGAQSTNVDIGIISNLALGADGVVTNIVTDIEDQTPGMPLMNLFGEVVGLASGDGVGSFIPASRVTTIEE